MINILYLDEFWRDLALFPEVFTPQEKYYLLLCKPHTESTEAYINRLVEARNGGYMRQVPTLGNENLIVMSDEEDYTNEFDGIYIYLIQIYLIIFIYR